MAGLKIASAIDHAARALEAKSLAERAHTDFEIAALHRRADAIIIQINALRQRIDDLVARAPAGRRAT